MNNLIEFLIRIIFSLRIIRLDKNWWKQIEMNTIRILWVRQLNILSKYQKRRDSPNTFSSIASYLCFDDNRSSEKCNKQYQVWSRVVIFLRFVPHLPIEFFDKVHPVDFLFDVVDLAKISARNIYRARLRNERATKMIPIALLSR